MSIALTCRYQEVMNCEVTEEKYINGSVWHVELKAKTFPLPGLQSKRKKKRRSPTPVPGRRRAWLMKWDHTHRVFEFFPAALCFQSDEDAPEMLSMLISQGDDSRGWMFSSCTSIGWLGWCLSERQALQLTSKFRLIQKTPEPPPPPQFSSDRGEKKNVKLNAPTDSLLIRHSGVFSAAPTALPESDTTPRETCELTNYSRDPTQMFNEEIWRLRTESWTALSFVIFYLSYCYSLQEVFNSSYSEFFSFFFFFFAHSILCTLSWWSTLRSDFI